MVSEETIRNYFAVVLIAILLFFSFMIIKPIFMSILLGLILAYIFNPLDKFFLKFVKNKFISALITCSLFLALLFLSFWFLIPLLASQVFELILTVQSLDVIGLMKRFFPFLFASEKISINITIAYNNFISNLTNYALVWFTNFLTNFSSLILKSLIVLIVFFYTLKDGDSFLKFIKDVLPFKKEMTNRFILKSKEVTFSVIFGRLVIGIIIGLLTGAGFFIAGVEKTLLLTFFAIIASVIPIIGPWLIWVPVVITLFVGGNIVPAILLLLYYGLFISFFDNFLHAIFIARKSSIPTSLTLISSIGGIFAFGFFGIILGPLIAAYLLTLIEIYRESNTRSSG
jgi:predicted PurR-regulated permease PerM